MNLAQHDAPAADLANSLWAEIEPRLPAYRHDHYRLYPARDPHGWERLLRERFMAASADPEVTIVASEDSSGLCVLGLTCKAWDEEHFGFPTGKVELLFSDAGASGAASCVARLFQSASARGVHFMTARVNGDELTILGALEERGFRYVENIIWPVARASNEQASCAELGVRLIRPDDVDLVAQIASTNQYQRGHFHCDPRIPRSQADSLYAKWVRSAFEQGRPILVIDDEDRAAGYFVVELAKNVSAGLGYSYGGFRSLGLKAESRGKRLGQRLFQGAMAWLRDQGCDYVDSGYATKNHLSAKLHSRAGFESVYEEVTLHCWLT